MLTKKETIVKTVQYKGFLITITKEHCSTDGWSGFYWEIECKSERAHKRMLRLRLDRKQFSSIFVEDTVSESASIAKIQVDNLYKFRFKSQEI